MVNMDVRENVINDVVMAMSPMMESIRLQMLEVALRNALHGLILEKECTELSTDVDNTQYMIDCFIANKKLENRAEGTLAQYRWTANRFFMAVGKGYRQITKDDVKYYLAVRQKQVSKNTVNNERRNLSSLFTWLHDEGLIEKNPVKSVKGKWGEETMTECFSVEDEVAIRDVLCTVRERAIIAFLFSTGVRVGEVHLLNISDVNMSKGSVTFRGEKSGRYRTVYLDYRAKKYLKEYLASRKDKHPALFVTERLYNGQPKRIPNAGFERITKRITAEAGVSIKGTVHVFRKTFATRLADRGCPLTVIQELLGHADPATTGKHYVAKSQKRTQQQWEHHAVVA